MEIMQSSDEWVTFILLSHAIYPGGWDGKFNDFKDNVGENDKNSNIESAESQNDPQGRSENT